MISLEAQLEAESIAYWFHICSPLDNWAVYEVLTDGLLAVKRERHDALAVHDYDRVAVLQAEINDLTELCGAAADGLALQRARFMAHGHRWPLGCLV